MVAAKLVADDARELSPADLDAVASTWATKSDSHSADDSAPSPTARSADVKLASRKSHPRPATGDRYGISSQLPTANRTVEIETPKNEAAELTAATEPTSDVQPQAAIAEPTPEVARGQEPNDDEKATAPPQLPAIRQPGLNPPAEPKSLELPASTTDLTKGDQRAPEAFRDEPATKAAAPTGARIGNRYATAPLAATATAPMNRETRIGNGQSVCREARDHPRTGQCARAARPGSSFAGGWKRTAE